MNNFYNSTISKDGNLYLHNLKIVKNKKLQKVLYVTNVNAHSEIVMIINF